MTNIGKPALSVLTLGAYFQYETKKFNWQNDVAIDWGNLNCTNPLNISCNPYDNVQRKRITTNISNTLKSYDLKNHDLYEIYGVSALGKSYGQDKYATFEELGQPLNGIVRIVNPKIFDQDLNSTFERASIVSYAKYAAKPTFLFTLEKDSLVSPVNFDHFIKIASDNNNTMVSSAILSNEKFPNC